MYLGMSPASRAATMPTTVPIRVPGRSPDPLTRAQAHADAGRKTASGCHQQVVVHGRCRHTPTGRHTWDGDGRDAGFHPSGFS